LTDGNKLSTTHKATKRKKQQQKSNVAFSGESPISAHSIYPSIYLSIVKLQLINFSLYISASRALASRFNWLTTQCVCVCS
jgi:hypothetical protein